MRNSLSLILTACLLLISCRHYYYVSNVQNVPLLKEKNEFQVSGSYGGWDESQSIEIQSAYSVTDKIGIMANFASVWGGKVSEHDYGRGSYFEMATGYFKTIEKNFEFEVYGGLGFSGQHHEYIEYHYNSSTGITTTQGGTSHLSFMKFFLQPSIALVSDNFDAAVSMRINSLNYTGIDYQQGSENNIADLKALNGKSHYFLEPALTLRAGWRNVKVQAQIAYNAYLNNPGLSFYEEAHLSGGLYFIIPVKTK